VSYLCPALADNGYLDVAYRLLLNETFPSWGYSINQGATTIWERWDGWTEDTGFQDKGMNSFNHYALGSIGQWLYQAVAGIDIGQPGFERIVIRPRVAEGLTHARAEYDSIRGKITSEWRIEDGLFRLSSLSRPIRRHGVHPGEMPSGGQLPAESAEGVARAAGGGCRRL
jgi:alpha-L-rhamnosidase